MCGIAGIFLKDKGPPSENILRKMTSVISHRGPDGEGLYIDGPVGIGHRRLSIIDLEGGDQPIFNEDRSMAIVFNGEIYNFRPLREELQKKGHKFTTFSDTEVILHAYEEFGHECVNYLRGMFCFAIWDSIKNELFLSRDRVGIKPLYYYYYKDKFLFGSEIKAILQDPDTKQELDPFALDDYLTYMYIPAPKSIFKYIKKLLPGHNLIVSKSGIKEHKYWDLTFNTSTNLKEEDYAEGLLEKIEESVNIHMVSDVPLGAFLSGGVDSSAVVGLMSKLVDRPVNTASIGFVEASFDELGYARLIADKFKTNAYEKTVKAESAKIIDSLVWFYDEPFADSSMVPTYYVSQVARERVTVSLSGDGADEHFAGYRRYRFDLMENRIRSILPVSLRKPVFGTLGSLYPKADWLPRIFRAKTLFNNLSLSPEEGYYNSMRWFDEEMKSKLYKDKLKKELIDYDPFIVMKEYFDRTKGLDPLSRIQYVDVKTYMADDILTKVDRASMAHSLEVRVPFLDHKVIEYAASIPAKYKLKGMEGKYILKKALEGFIPDEILYRPKMGFSIPLAKWFRNDLKEIFEDRVLSENSWLSSYFNLRPIEYWWGLHQKGIRDYSYHFWALLVLESWARRFLAE